MYCLPNSSRQLQWQSTSGWPLTIISNESRSFPIYMPYPMAVPLPYGGTAASDPGERS